ncbi:hypothetical protein K435DRAFT_564989, partial [Dendrothele bispora CBS 962.96]
QRRPRYSLLPALTLNGTLYAQVVEGSFTKLRFQSFIEGLLNRMDREMAPGSVIIMDNARIHKDEGLKDLIES